MGETSEIVKSTIEKVLERVDALAAKLGIAAGEIWKFSVTAKAVEARADMAKYGALLLLPLIFWGWGLHVAFLKLPHDTKYRGNYESVQSAPMPCDQMATMNGKTTILHEQCWQTSQRQVQEDDGLSQIGWLLLLSGILCAIAGIVVSVQGVSGLIDGYASTKTAEYDAYQDLLYDWKD